jgi:hypothetical protein
MSALAVRCPPAGMPSRPQRVSRIVTTLVAIVKSVLAEFVPNVQEAIEMVNGRVCLVDGTITPVLVL